MHNNPPLARAAEGCALDTIEEAYTVRMTDFFWLAGLTDGHKAAQEAKYNPACKSPATGLCGGLGLHHILSLFNTIFCNWSVLGPAFL